MQDNSSLLAQLLQIDIYDKSRLNKSFRPRQHFPVVAGSQVKFSSGRNPLDGRSVPGQSGTGRAVTKKTAFPEKKNLSVAEFREHF